MTAYETLKQNLRKEPRKWLITGVAGFIGSNLLEELLKLDQTVVGLDSFATGRRENLTDVSQTVSPKQWAGFKFIEGDICQFDTCCQACNGVDYVLHQAALGSVPRSIENPLASHHANVTGFLNMVTAARDSKVKRFVYASSSSVYGDSEELPKVENKTGNLLSPYAATKAINEVYADVYARVYGVPCVGLRYFNVFGPKQDPNGAYAAVIPKWIIAMLQNQPATINGDGTTSRDFCHVANAVQANLLAATAPLGGKEHEVFNIALNDRTTLNELFELIRSGLVQGRPYLANYTPTYRPFRSGDIKHSLADVGKATELLGYQPEYTIKQGMPLVLEWYEKHYRTN
ncbi:MAG: SDR family oxidoreductase [Opitutaceae bacterium]|nr:SDR family oxidoreductase [Opitutaceae bacterium]